MREQKKSGQNFREDEPIPEKKKSNEIDGVAFQLRKGDGILNPNETMFQGQVEMKPR